MASPGASIATSGATLQNPPGTPLPPPRKAGNGAFVAALLAGAGAGACYVYDAQNKTASTVTPVRSVTPETQTEETRAGETKGDPPKATPAEAPAPGRALNLRRLFAFEKQRERVAKDIGALATEKVAVTKVVTERSVTPETQTPKREETPTDPTPTPTPTPTPVAFKKVKEVTQEVPPEANEKVSLVFGTAADALLAVADAAAEAERIEVANEKERRASFAASETSSRDLNLDSNSAGPASATRAISLQTVSTNGVQDSNASAIHSNARSRQTATETDERLAPSATSSRGAAEVCVFFSSSFFFFSFSVFSLLHSSAPALHAGSVFIGSKNLERGRAHKNEFDHSTRRRVPGVSWGRDGHPLHRKHRTKSFPWFFFFCWSARVSSPTGHHVSSLSLPK